MFQPYKGWRAFEEVAEQIKQAILSNRLSNGDRLPSERELAAQFQVGRVTIREAMRMLETMGLIEIKKGSTGGAFVRIAELHAMASLIMDRLQLEGTTHDQMTEARVGIECAIIKSAIEHATKEDLKRIAQDVKESKEILEPVYAKQIVDRMINFHILVAEASRNLPYIMFLRSMMEWASRKLETWIPTPDDQVFSYESHKEMFEAITNKDVKLAQRLMEEHIESMGILVGRFAKSFP